MRLSLLLAAMAVLMLVALPVSAQEDITVVYNGADLATTAAPVEQDGRVLIGMRDIFEAMNAAITWDSATRTVTATQGVTTVMLTIGSKVAYVNARAVALDVAAQIINESTYVPLRFVAEATGAEVRWFGVTRTVEITTGAGGGMPRLDAPAGPVPSPTVTSPRPNESVGPAVTVTGRAIGGATIRIVTKVYRRDTDELMSTIPGIVHNVPVDGSYSHTIALPSARGNDAREMYYDIHVWTVDRGQQSRPTIVRVNRK